MATKLWVGTDSGNEGDLNVAANWSPSGVPSGGDDVVFRDSDQDADTSLDALSAVELGSLTIHQSLRGTLARRRPT